jgi:hypothetical protein
MFYQKETVKEWY